MNLRKSIKFKNGKLKVLQISDLQDTKCTSVDTLRFMEDAVSKINPDLIVFTGDQLDVVGLWGKGEKARANVKTAIKRLFSVFEKFDIPYVLTFGNHDCETGVSNEEQAKIYAEFKNCICFDDFDDGRPDAATFNVPVLSSDESRTALNFYIMDSHTKTKGVGYEGVNAAQLEWYKRTSEALKEENGGKSVPSMVFQHIPVSNMMEVFKEVPKGTKGAQCDFVKSNSRYWVLDDEKIFDEFSYGETPSMTLGTEQFDTMRAQGDVFAMYFGHDHYNSFAGKVDGIDLGYCPGAGYNCYGNKERNVRVFEFDEDDVTAYKTYTLSYGELCGRSETAPVKNAFSCRAPSSTSAAGAFAVKVLSILVPVILVLVLVDTFLKIKLMLGLFIALLLTAVIYTPISAVYNKILRNKLTGGK